jgi:molecular chaperone DnaK
MSIGIGLPGGRVKTIIERNTPLPTRKQYGLATTRDGQTEFELVVVQGESQVAAECEYLGTLKLADLPPGPRGMVKIAVTFELGAECLLTVTARELNTGRQVKAQMSAKEGAAAARKKLETTPTGSPAPRITPGAMPAVKAPVMAPGAAVPGSAPEGALAGFLRRLFGKERNEAR